MKNLIYAALLIALCGCSKAAVSEDGASVDAKAMEQGRSEAREAIKEKRGSMAREKAILQLRVNEEKMRQKGDSLKADSYVMGVQWVFDSISE